MAHGDFGGDLGRHPLFSGRLGHRRFSEIHPDDYFFPKGKVYYRGGDWLKVRRPYKEELLWAEELKKEWRDKEMKWQKEQEREREEELVRALNGK